MTSAETVWILIPELLLLLLAAWTYVAGAFQQSRNGFHCVAIAGLVVAAVALYRQSGGGAVAEGAFANGPLIVDWFGHAARWLALAVGLLLILVTWRGGAPALSTEYLGSLILVISGLLTVAVAGDLVLLFLGLELVTIPTYILLYLGRGDGRSQEATIKYFFLSVLSSALLLYGFAWLYGAVGSTRLVDVASVLRGADPETSRFVRSVPLAIVLIFAGLSFKLAAVPFHFYAPDVYQGATSGNAAILSVVPKIAGMVALIRLLIGAMPVEAWARIGWQLALAVAVVTMTLGNVTALRQRSLRRMMAYSSIAHSGYMLIGIAVALAAVDAESGAADGIAATFFYLAVYSFATVGTFAALATIERNGQEIEKVDDLAGLGTSRPWLALALAVFMFSLTGIPPLAGFWGKLRLFQGALAFGATQSGALYGWFMALVVIAAVNAAVSAGYYLRVIARIYFRQASAPKVCGGMGPQVAVAIAAACTIAIGVAPRILWTPADRASQSVSARHESPQLEAVAMDVVRHVRP